MTSLTWTSRQARTHRLHWMHASSWTAIAGRPVRAGCSRVGKRLSAISIRSAQPHSRLVRSCASESSGWSASSSSITIRRACRARSVAVKHLHAGRRLPDAGCCQHPLSLDLHHARPGSSHPRDSRARAASTNAGCPRPHASPPARWSRPATLSTSRPSSMKRMESVMTKLQGAGLQGPSVSGSMQRMD